MDALRQPIAHAARLENIRLADAHSLLWLFSTLLRMEAKGEHTNSARASERYLGAREKPIAEIKYSVGKTVFNSNDQVIETKVKNKEQRMPNAELDKLLRELLEVQGERCAITGLPLQFRGAHSDDNMLPSLDRINTGGHYERGNLQIVCRFINFCKQAADDSEFRRLRNVVRGIEVSVFWQPEGNAVPTSQAGFTAPLSPFAEQYRLAAKVDALLKLKVGCLKDPV
ncbi:hypothetical protein R3X27_07880 [Tropicimonas sp. TH_r6]|uniref:hypothetical protein n=1 Tax=Tropicimonas sp. TH_r6 TaxID=3082085 RepID=UPI0029529F2F|nr:hypothetical protein [Tropicimonas sp. TH_r6]MDV7142598.1 hypothetical protein [Tropicimonas sp. TH_r6]